MTDLPALPDELAAELEAVTPESITEVPPCNPDDLSPDSIRLIREWLHAVQSSDVTTVLQVTALSDEALDQTITAIVGDHRDLGIDLRDRRDLLVTYHALQLNFLMIQRDWAQCGDVHTYVHFARPLVNLALAYELLLLEVFGSDAAYYPEGGE